MLFRRAAARVECKTNTDGGEGKACLAWGVAWPAVLMRFPLGLSTCSISDICIVLGSKRKGRFVITREAITDLQGAHPANRAK